MLTSGLSAMVRLAASLELDAEHIGEWTMQTLSIGAPQNSLAGTSELQIAGAHLLYAVSIRGEQVIVSASLLDSIAEPEVLMKARDVERDWETAFRFISALEKYEVRSLERPIHVGPVGEPDAWVIS